tara:strand:+ start:1305 stop:1952 length:648 start_codon:yes stop_codon:yes gene_type:complete
MRLKLLITFSLFNILNGQENKNLNYKEDQIYFNFNFDFQLKSIENYQQNGFSRSFNTGLLKDISLNEKGNKALAFGLGYGFSRLVSNLDVAENLNFIIQGDSTLRNRLSYHSIQFPVELRLRTSTLESFAFWRVYLGYRLNYNFSAKYKPFFGRETELKNLVSEFSHCLSLSLGFDSWNIRFETGLSPVIKISSISNNTNNNFYVSSIGLVFYLL